MFADVNECASNPCVNGECFDEIGEYLCTCHPGWTGERCDEG